MKAISLSRLFSEIPFFKGNIYDRDPQIRSITADSRHVQPGSIFVAMGGGSVDGHQFIPNAIAAGASAIIGEAPFTRLSVPYFQVENSRQVLAHISAAFYDFPARKMTMIGITGTDGKTSTCNILHHILIAAGYKTGLISTVNAIIGDEILDTGFHVTTPDAPEVQRYLAKMVDAGLTHVILETTSHGWAQYRVDACEFDIGIFTNITHEHLDYHGSYENYRFAKARLITSLSETINKKHGNIRLAVINYDDSSYSYLNEVATTKVVSYGLSGRADVFADNIQHITSGTKFRIQMGDIHLSVNSNLYGLFNVSNCLAAAAAALQGLHIPEEAVITGIASIKGVPGRMERIALGQNFLAFVDFAHTPNALKVALETANLILLDASVEKSQPRGRIIAIFGSAGLRDKQKRKMMAEVSNKYADISIFTAEDPRTESLNGILDEMAQGARQNGGIEEMTFWRVKDRREAIRVGIQMARPGDLVIACGKGHEQSMCFGTVEYSWDDRIAMRAALSEYLGIDGIEMPFLPIDES